MECPWCMNDCAAQDYDEDWAYYTCDVCEHSWVELRE